MVFVSDLHNNFTSFHNVSKCVIFLSPPQKLIAYTFVANTCFPIISRHISLWWFTQVGGEFSNTVIPKHMKMFGRIVLVGNISGYNADITTPRKGMFALHKTEQDDLWRMQDFRYGGRGGAPTSEFGTEIYY